MRVWDRIEFTLISTTCRLVVYLSYLSTKTHRHNYLRIRNTIRTRVAEEMYSSLTFPRPKQYKTIDDELTITHLLPEKKLIRYDRRITWNTKSTKWSKNRGVKVYVKALYLAWHDKRFVGAKIFLPSHACFLLSRQEWREKVSTSPRVLYFNHAT